MSASARHAAMLALPVLLGAAYLATTVSASTQSGESSVRLACGARTTIELPENPSTGHVWRFDVQRSKNAGIVAIVDQGFSPNSTDRRRVGAPGRHRWQLEGLTVGHAELIFMKSRPWEERPTGEHRVAVEVH